MDQQINYREVKDEEKRRRVAAELSADPTRSTRIIAKAAGVSQSTAFRIRKELESHGDARLLETKKEAPKIVNRTKASDSRFVRARNELLRDPKRSNHIIAKAVGLSPDTIRHLRIRMEITKEIPVIPAEDRLNALGTVGRAGGGGSKIGVPADIPLMQLTAKGLLLEEEKPDLTLEEVALLLGIHSTTYRDLRSVKLLSMRDDLSRSDAKLVQEVVAKIEKTRQIKPILSDIKPLVRKIWGRKAVGLSGTKIEAKRKTAFDHAVGLISDMCLRGPEVEIPYLSEEEQVAALHKVTEAIGCLKQLNANIRKARG